MIFFSKSTNDFFLQNQPVIFFSMIFFSKSTNDFFKGTMYCVIISLKTIELCG